jgi:hypothetical protein
MTWHHFCVAGAALYTDGVEKLVRGGQKARIIACFLLLSTSKIEEVSQHSFFWRLPRSKLQDVMQNCFVFDVATFKP